jgi:hypothetical protein
VEVVEYEEDRLLPGQPLEQPADRLEQPGPLRARVTERRRRRQMQAVEEAAEIRQPFDQPGSRARLDSAYERS